MGPFPSFPTRPPPARRDPNPDDLNRVAASHRHLALRCRKLAPDETGQHAAFEAMAVDEQRRVYAMATAGEEPQRPTLLGAHARLRRGGRHRIGQIAPSASCPASVIRTFTTSIILPPARIFSTVMINRLRFTSPVIMAPPKPCATKNGCVSPLRPACASIASARRCSGLSIIGWATAAAARLDPSPPRASWRRLTILRPWARDDAS